MKKIILGLIVVTLAPAVSLADAVAPGNLLVVTDDVIYETQTDGTIVQSFATQYPGGYPPTEYARDVAVDAEGLLHFFNGTFTPYMSTYDPVAGTWTHRTYPNWKTVNNISYGGIDVLGSQVFVTDMLTEPGVVVFQTDTEQAFRFAAGTDAIDLTIGLDGLLYVLSPGGSPGGRVIDVYDPETYAYIRTIDLTAILGWSEHRAIAVDYNGDVFIADWDGEVHRINAADEPIQTFVPPCDWLGEPVACSFTDIDISELGQIALGSRVGEVVITDVYFSTVTKFEIDRSFLFVEWVPQPPLPTAVDIDIRPGRDPNKINLTRKTNVWVAILTTPDFDATTVDPASVALGPNAAGINRSARLQDVDGDGDIDIRLRFTVRDIGIVCGDTSLTLTGLTFDGTEIVGSDSIVTRGCN